MMMLTATTGTSTTGAIETIGTTGTTEADMMRGTLTEGSEDEDELAMITVEGEK